MEAKEFLHKVSGDFYSVIEKYYIDFLNNTIEEEKAVENLIELIQCDFETDESIQIESIREENEYETVLSEIGGTVYTLIENLIKQDLSEEIFYKKLLKTIKDDTFFVSDLSKVCALIQLIKSPKMPYYYLSDGVKMENDEFIEITKLLITKLRKVRFVLNAGLSQKTEVSSKILQILEETTNSKEKIVLLANIIGMFEHKIVLLEKQLKNQTAEMNK